MELGVDFSWWWLEIIYDYDAFSFWNCMKLEENLSFLVWCRVEIWSLWKSLEARVMGPEGIPEPYIPGNHQPGLIATRPGPRWYLNTMNSEVACMLQACLIWFVYPFLVLCRHPSSVRMLLQVTFANFVWLTPIEKEWSWCRPNGVKVGK